MTNTQTAMEKQAASSVQGDAQRMERRPLYVPATDVYERDDALVIVADMPGVGEKDVKIDLDNNVLTLRGRATALKQEGFDALFSEFAGGDYERSFQLSDDVDRDAIKASLKNGVLRVELPKAEQAKPRKISVQTG